MPSQMPTLLKKFHYIWFFDPTQRSPVWPKGENFTCILVYSPPPLIWYIPHDHLWKNWIFDPQVPPLGQWPRQQNENPVRYVLYLLFVNTCGIDLLVANFFLCCLLQFYSVAVIGYRVATFNNCLSAAEELQSVSSIGGTDKSQLGQKLKG